MNLAPTPSGWLQAVRADFDGFLKDHASCEKKASGMALNIASHYPDRPALLEAMVELAVEELSHYREVVRILLARGSHPGADRRDGYVRALNGLVRRGPDVYLLDRLLVAAVVERRGAERFGLLAHMLPGTEPSDPQLEAFYRAIASSENRHWQMFVDLARRECPDADVDGRLAELVAREADIMLSQPLQPALH